MMLLYTKKPWPVIKNALSKTWKIQAKCHDGDMLDLNHIIGDRKESDLTHNWIFFKTS